jgi:hypothetical protein
VASACLLLLLPLSTRHSTTEILAADASSIIGADCVGLSLAVALGWPLGNTKGPPRGGLSVCLVAVRAPDTITKVIQPAQVSRLA